MLSPLASNRRGYQTAGGRPCSARGRVSEPPWSTAYTFRYLRPGAAGRKARKLNDAVAQNETSQPPLRPPHERGSSASWGRRHQYDPGLVGTCLVGHYPCLRGGRSRNEG